jgi:hypothetical protein
MIMSRLKHLIALTGILAASMFAGCIYSGTFVIDETFTPDPMADFHFGQVDITTDATWQKHKDDIHLIDAVGFEMWFHENVGNDATSFLFNAFANNFSDPPMDDSIPTAAHNVVKNLNVSMSSHKISYAQSLSAINKLEELKNLVKTGKFDYYHTVESDDVIDITVDSVRVIITFTAGE